MWWEREAVSREFRARDCGRCFAVPAGVSHAAIVTGWFGVFANLERWHGPRDSACRDFRMLG
jgi:hypothetical protein